MLPRPAHGTYYFFVELQSFNNPGNRDFDGGCCEPGCGACDNYFIFCLRPSGYDQNSNVCPYGSYSTSAKPREGSSLTFSTGSTALASNVPNPVRFAGGVWPVSILYVATYVARIVASSTIFTHERRKLIAQNNLEGAYLHLLLFSIRLDFS